MTVATLIAFLQTQPPDLLILRGEDADRYEDDDLPYYYPLATPTRTHVLANSSGSYTISGPHPPAIAALVL